MKRFSFLILVVLAVGFLTAEVTTIKTLPGLPVGSVQYNNLNNFKGASDFTYSSMTHTVNVASMTASGTVIAAKVQTSIVVTSSFIARGVGYNPPPTDGSNGQVLTTNGSGGLSWATSSGGGAVGNTTYPVTMVIDGPVYLATSTPIVSDYVAHGTSTIVGFQAFVSKASSVSITQIELVISSRAVAGDPPAYGQYGKTYTPITFRLNIGTNATASVYVSTVIPIWQDCEWGVRVTTISDSQNGTTTKGLPAENIKIKAWKWDNWNTTW